MWKSRTWWRIGDTGKRAAPPSVDSGVAKLGMAPRGSAPRGKSPSIYAISTTLQTPVAVLVLLNAQNPPLATVKYSGTLGGIFMLDDVTVAETAEPSNCNQPCTSEHTRTCTVAGENAVDGTDVALPA
jgi:hypothetical protein